MPPAAEINGLVGLFDDCDDFRVFILTGDVRMRFEATEMFGELLLLNR